jgi:hypothetical protein
MTFFVIASEAKQSIAPQARKLDCFVASLLAMTGINTVQIN